jgi:hypothetical protein
MRGIGAPGPNEAKLIQMISAALSHSSVVEFRTKNCIEAGLTDFYCNSFGYETTRRSVVEGEGVTTYVTRATKKEAPVSNA